MSKVQDLSGNKYGKLTAIRISHKKNRNIYWLWKCDCGNEKVMTAGAIKAGKVVSCGCYNKENNYIKTTHGKSHSHEYKSWLCMLRRVSGKEERYAKYVELGIHSEWINSFQPFYSHIGDAPSKKHTIDRIDNDKGYYPGNVRWATRKEQNRNYSQNRIIEYKGEKRSVTEWAEYLNIPRHRIFQRIYKGCSIEEAIERG